MKNTSDSPLYESQRLRQLVREIGFPLNRLPEILPLGAEDCMNWWSDRNIRLSAPHKAFQNLGRIIGIAEDQLYRGDYNRDLARKHLLGDHRALPGRYQDNQNSFVRTSEHIIRYVVLTRGQAFVDWILSCLNVSPLIYQNPGAKINLTYFSDLLAVLAKNGFQQEELDTLASVIFLSLQKTPLGKHFKISENFFEIYKTLAENFDYFDSNFEYKSRFVGRKYILNTTLPLKDHSQLKGNPQDVQRLLRYRHILLAWFPYLAGMSPLYPQAEVFHSADVVKLQYEFDLTTISKQPKTLSVI